MKKIIALGAVLSIPMLVSAEYVPTTFDSIITILLRYLGYVVPALITIAVIWFIWGVITFMTSADEEQKKMGRSKIINGLIGLFVIVTFWGIIGIVKNTFGVGSATDSIIPITPTTPRV